MKNKLRKFVGLMVSIVAPITLNFSMTHYDLLTPLTILPTSVLSACLIGMGVFIFEGFMK